MNLIQDKVGKGENSFEKEDRFIYIYKYLRFCYIIIEVNHRFIIIKSKGIDKSYRYIYIYIRSVVYNNNNHQQQHANSSRDFSGI